MDKYRISLTAEERSGLEPLVSRGKSSARKLTHARILLLADELQGEARANTESVSVLGISLRTIERVRKCFVTAGCEAALDHRPQPPRPDKIKIKGADRKFKRHYGPERLGAPSWSPATQRSPTLQAVAVLDRRFRRGYRSAARGDVEGRRRERAAEGKLWGHLEYPERV